LEKNAFGINQKPIINHCKIMIPLQVSQVRNIGLAKSTKVKYSNLRLVYTKLFAI